MKLFATQNLLLGNRMLKRGDPFDGDESMVKKDLGRQKKPGPLAEELAMKAAEEAMVAAEAAEAKAIVAAEVAEQASLDKAQAAADAKAKVEAAKG